MSSIASAPTAQKLCLLALLATLGACAEEAGRTHLPAHWRPTPNFDTRRPEFVVIHYTAMPSADAALRAMDDRSSAVSAHYLVARDGVLYQLVNERDRAWHAGRSRWGADSDVNSSSIGIELDNDGVENFTDAQIDALIALLDDLKTRYQIPARNFLGHGDVAPGRKLDPGPLFPWKKLADHGFGLWCDPPYRPRGPDFDASEALRLIGYDIADLSSAIGSFRLHFAPQGASGRLSSEEMDQLNCLADQAR